MDALFIIFVIIISLWSITKTLEKIANKVLEKQDRQIQLLEEIKTKIDSHSNE